MTAGPSLTTDRFSFADFRAPAGVPDPTKGGESHMTFRDWFDLVRMYSKREEGQTMAEYGVVLAVITLGVVVALGALALAITGKLNGVTAKLTP